MTRGSPGVVFYADANATIGMGHLIRCLSLAEGFREIGVESHFFSTSLDPKMESVLSGRGYSSTVGKINGDCGLNSLIETCDRLGATELVLDKYGLPAQFAQALRKKNSDFVIGQMEDWLAPLDSLDIIINQNIYATEGDYHFSSDPHPVVLAGPAYALLRPEFRKTKRKPYSSQKVERVLLTLGGSDQSDNLLKILHALLEVSSDVEFHVVTGSAASSDRLMSSWPGGNSRIVPYSRVENMCELMSRMDISINASGSTLWELYYLGIPNMIYVLADNQKRIGEAADLKGYSLYLGEMSHFEKLPLQNKFTSLVSSYDQRKKLSEQGQSAVDGRGVERVRDEFLKRVKI